MAKNRGGTRKAKRSEADGPPANGSTDIAEAASGRDDLIRLVVGFNVDRRRVQSLLRALVSHRQFQSLGPGVRVYLQPGDDYEAARGDLLTIGRLTEPACVIEARRRAKEAASHKRARATSAA